VSIDALGQEASIQQEESSRCRDYDGPLSGICTGVCSGGLS
jgi:hypothetical protein